MARKGISNELADLKEDDDPAFTGFAHGTCEGEARAYECDCEIGVVTVPVALILMSMR